jgi:O-antigen ligase
VNATATRLANIATSGATLFVLLIFAPSLQAPFLVPKFAALELAASLGLVAFALQRATGESPRWSRGVTIGAGLVLATSALSWVAASARPLDPFLARTLASVEHAGGGAPYALASMARWGSLLGIACGASVLDDANDGRRRALEGVVLAAGAVAALGLLQHVELNPLPLPVISTPGSTFGNRNLAAEVMAMALPLGLAPMARARGWQGRWILGFALALELVYLAVTRARGAWLGGVCGLGTTLWAMKLRWPRGARWAAAGAFVVAIVAVSLPGRFNPRDAGDRKRYSGVVDVVEEGFDAHATALKTRLGLWRRTLPMVYEHPILGVGPGNWPVEFPRFAEPGATRDGVLSATLAPRQAHNDYLERAAETGIVGLGAFGVLVAAVIVSARRWLQTGEDDPRAIAAGAAGALVSLLVVSLASFPLDMPGTLTLAGLALGLLAGDARCAMAPGTLGAPASISPPTSGGATTKRGPRALAMAGVVIGFGLFLCAAERTERKVKSSRWLESAERAMHSNSSWAAATEAIGVLNLALEAEPRDYRAQLRAAQLLLRVHLLPEAERAAQEAIALEPYSPNPWAALAAAELEAGDYAGAKRDATRAIELLHDYPFALQLRAQAAEQKGDAAAAQDDRQRLRELASGAEGDPTARAARLLIRSATERGAERLQP